MGKHGTRFNTRSTLFRTGSCTPSSRVQAVWQTRCRTPLPWSICWHLAAPHRPMTTEEETALCRGRPMFDFRFGIEEEYFIVDRQTASVRPRLSRPFMEAAKRKLGPNLMYELLQSQVEVATNPVSDSREARQQLRHFRSVLSDIGQQYQVGIVAAGTH